MATRSKRRKLDSDLNDLNDAEISNEHSVYTPLTRVQRDSWNGFCEIESEPSLFNVMLRRFGVKGVKVQEVVSLDDEMLGLLNRPVYGLIFLFRWREDDPAKQEQSCPDGVWFANQTVNYSCASVALLNIINNIDEVELGDELENFKNFTMDFTPALRGDAVSKFKFVRDIHNSFARKMDVLSADLQLKTEIASKKAKSKKRNQASDDSEAGFHFIAFVHAKDQVWKFDGLERQPQNLGETMLDDWLNLAKPEIMSRMAEYEEDQIEFSILSLAKDPMTEHVANLGSNVKSLSFLNRRLDELHGSPLASDSPHGGMQYNDEYILGPDPSFLLNQADLDHAQVSEDLTAKCKTENADNIFDIKRDLIARQKALRLLIKEEQQSRQIDEDYAESRTHDYGPAICHWLRLLAQKGLVEELASDFI